MQIAVVGAGVNGLTCAVVLAELGHTVRVHAQELALQSTSSVAAAIWYPHRTDPQSKVREWALTTLRTLQCLAVDVPQSGVAMVKGRKLFHRRMGPPWWRDSVPDFILRKMPDGARAGYECTLPIADSSRYLPYLYERALRAKVIFQKGTVHDLAAIPGDLVVNCSGLGARELAGDGELFPIRGQVVCVAGGAVSEFLLDTDHSDGAIYVIPRTDDIVLGGVSQDRDTSLVSREEETKSILARCRKALPALGKCEIRVVKVGLRPGRAAVRLEKETLANGCRVIHNYGHGGGGFTLSWGCAVEVASLLLR